MAVLFSKRSNVPREILDQIATFTTPSFSRSNQEMSDIYLIRLGFWKMYFFQEEDNDKDEGEGKCTTGIPFLQPKWCQTDNDVMFVDKRNQVHVLPFSVRMNRKPWSLSIPFRDRSTNPSVRTVCTPERPLHVTERLYRTTNNCARILLQEKYHDRCLYHSIQLVSDSDR